jgi:hypothetical protein
MLRIKFCVLNVDKFLQKNMLQKVQMIFAILNLTYFPPCRFSNGTIHDNFPPKILFAVSPLLALAYVLMTGFDEEGAEKAKRSKKGDFTLAGHEE